MGAGPRSTRLSLFPSSMRRRQVRRRWEKKWERTDQFPWQAGGVAPELAHAVDAGWLGHGTSILDAGCGSGENAAWLAGRGFRVVGIDVAPAAIDEAISTYRGVPDLAFAVVDVTRPGVLDRQFDGAVDRGCLHIVPAELQRRYAANLTRWVRPGGSLLLTMHTQNDWRPDDRRRQAIDLLSPDFSIEDTLDDVTIGSLGRRDIVGVMFHLVRR